jgi:hypothetical protein
MIQINTQAALREALSNFMVLIGGCQASEVSARACRVLHACPSSIVQLHLRCSNIDRLEFQIYSNFEVTPKTIPLWAGAWCDLSAALAKILSQSMASVEGQVSKVLVDLTDVDWELGFFVLPMLYSNPLFEVTCAFTSPQSYPQAGNNAEHPPIQTRYIRQPPGWMADLASRAVSPKHVLFLGFDHDRAQKFLEHYNWVPGNCIAVFGDPPYIGNGRAISEKANQLLLQNIPDTPANRMAVDAANPLETVALLNSILGISDSIDVILLGTSPMTLGAVWFYLRLSKAEKQRVRFLHDFPQRQASRTIGVGNTWLYPMPSKD